MNPKVIKKNRIIQGMNDGYPLKRTKMGNSSILACFWAFEAK